MSLKRILVALLFLFLAILLAYISGEFLARFVYTPIINILKIFYVVLKALPQTFWWGLIILALMLVVRRSLRWKVIRELDHSTPQKIPQSPARTWTRMVEKAESGAYSNWMLTNQLSEMIVQNIAHREQLTRDEVERGIINGTLELTPEIKTFLTSSFEAPSFSHYWDLISKAGLSDHQNSISPDIVEVIKYLESYN